MINLHAFQLFLKVQESRQNHDDEAVKKAVNEYDEALERSKIYV